MRDLLVMIVKNIATEPDAVVIDEVDEGGMVTYTITVSPTDMGRIIGKSGKVIKSIRNIAHVAAIRQGKRYRINVAEVGGQSTDVEASVSEPEEGAVVYETPTAQPVAPAADDIVAEAMDDEA